MTEAGATGPPGPIVPEVVKEGVAPGIGFVTTPSQRTVAKIVMESELKKRNAILKNVPVSLDQVYYVFS